jgi:hypothetical protein
MREEWRARRKNSVSAQTLLCLEWMCAALRLELAASSVVVERKLAVTAMPVLTSVEMKARYPPESQITEDIVKVLRKKVLSFS